MSAAQQPMYGPMILVHCLHTVSMVAFPMAGLLEVNREIGPGIGKHTNTHKENSISLFNVDVGGELHKII